MAYLSRAPQSPRDDQQPVQWPSSAYSANPLSPARNPNRLSGGMSANDVRASLPRRFTTNALPTLSPIGQQRRQAATGENTMQNGGYARIPASERRLRHIEGLIEQQRRIAAELEQVDDETRRTLEENLRHERAVTQMIAQSEPTTPPEYQDSFSSTISRPNRYSTTSLTSSAVSNRTNRSSAQLTSPTGGFVRPYASATNNLPSQSVPGSRRQSDGEEDDEDDFPLGFDTAIHRAAANPNRNSMPVTSYDRKRNAADFSSGLGPLNTTSFLFDDDEHAVVLPNKTSASNLSPPEPKRFLEMQHTADGFPKLISRQGNGEQLPVTLAPFDLEVPQETQVADRAAGARHRMSMPPTTGHNVGIAPLNGILANSMSSAVRDRRSMEVTLGAEPRRPSLLATPPRGMTNGTAQSSYSTNDIPTMKSIAASKVDPAYSSVAESSPEKNSNAITPSTSISTSKAAAHRRSVEITPPTASGNGDVSHFNHSHSGLQANATPFGPMGPTPYNHMQPVNSYQAAGYGIQIMQQGMADMNLHPYGAQAPAQAPAQWPQQQQQQMLGYQASGYGPYGQYSIGGPVAAGAGTGAGRHMESHRAAPYPRLAEHEQLFKNARVGDLQGQIYGLCKDQHGCRFLQRKLEEKNAQDTQIIFDEVKNHFQELMTDPFGNYLCQRLLDFANVEQRTVLAQNAASGMTKIALNQHGTRALQKMIEFVATPQQTQIVINALRNDVVQLIQDLNGNHVIQKCLNHLSSQDAQFIFDAVGNHCTVVGTHRHGCCVLQRCVDHASGLQKGQLVDRIINHALELVQDPFGNYVVQYILDLSEPCFTEPLCKHFAGNIVVLSKQKFSSNVIEKCIRTASHETRRQFISEIAAPPALEQMLRDNYANYVVQTALEFADPKYKELLVENIRPMLPAIRQMSYGRRIANKITDYDNPSLGLPASALQTLQEPRSTAPTNNNRAHRNATMLNANTWVHSGAGGALTGRGANHNMAIGGNSAMQNGNHMMSYGANYGGRF